MIEFTAVFKSKLSDEYESLGIDYSEDAEFDKILINPMYITSVNPSSTEGWTTIFLTDRSCIVTESYDNVKDILLNIGNERNRVV